MDLEYRHAFTKEIPKLYLSALKELERHNSKSFFEKIKQLWN
jgi:hypothetical protein